ncbi:MAG: DUF2460 domain-containing protein [Rhizomicrobium sp.]
MSSFHEVRFPPAIAFASTGGPERKTEIITLGSGYEERNAVWANSRRRYNVGYGLKSLDDIHSLTAFFEARYGRLYGFRFKDFADYKSCAPLAAITATDQTIATADGTTKTYQLKKLYSSGSYSWTRSITKPVAGSVTVALCGVVQSTGWSIDTTTGSFAFDTAPASGATVSAGFEFDVPARFDSDRLTINLASFNTGEVPDIALTEIRL